MKELPQRWIWRTGLRIGLLSCLLPLALSSTAQTNWHWRGSVTRAPTTGAQPQPATATPTTSLDTARFDAIAQALVADGRVPGLAMAIVKNGRIVSLGGYGVTDVSNPQPIDGHTVFRLASLSKAFASTVTGLLVNDGLLRWDSHLTDYIPTFQMSTPGAAQQLTVADLLSHRTGLTHNAFDRDIESNADYHALTQKIASAPMACAPGQCYAYQNVAFSMIGDIVFATTGKFYSETVASRIFKPLGMHDASYGLEGIEASGRWARPHVRAGNGWASLMPKPTYYRLAPAAGVNASISDMAQWLLAQGGHRPDVLPAPLLATLHAPLIATPSETRATAWRRARVDAASYALGWRVYDYAAHALYYHGGAVQGYRGVIALLPDQDMGVVILWNSESALPSGLLPTILDSALGIGSDEWLDAKTAALYPSLITVAARKPTGLPGHNAAAASPN